jgi:hypothetical protein
MMPSLGCHPERSEGSMHFPCTEIHGFFATAAGCPMSRPDVGLTWGLFQALSKLTHSTGFQFSGRHIPRSSPPETLSKMDRRPATARMDGSSQSLLLDGDFSMKNKALLNHTMKNLRPALRRALRQQGESPRPKSACDKQKRPNSGILATAGT